MQSKSTSSKLPQFLWGSFNWHTFKLSLLSHVQSTDGPSTAFFISATVCLIFNNSFGFLEFQPLCLHYPPVLGCFLLFFIKALSMLIIVVLNSWSDNSKTLCYICIWFWCLVFLFRLCLLPFSMPCNLLLKARQY